MDSVAMMLGASPVRPFAPEEPLAEAIGSCIDCAQACTACADACIGEQMVGKLRLCIRLTLDTADICEASARVLGRQQFADTELVRSLLQTAVLAARRCAIECDRHRNQHAHCRLCAESCRACEAALETLLREMPTTPHPPATGH